MRMIPDRAVLTVQQSEGLWGVQLDSELFGQCLALGRETALPLNIVHLQ